MFEIRIGHTDDQVNVVEKDFKATHIMNGYLRQNTSVTDPVFVVELPVSSFEIRGLNYAYVAAFGRYYFINEIVLVSGHDMPYASGDIAQLWEIRCHVDVLMSFANEIKNQTAVVARQEQTYNLMLDDGFFMAYQNPRFQTKVFSNPTPFETQEFVLIVAGS